MTPKGTADDAETTELQFFLVFFELRRRAVAQFNLKNVVA
jgi:hypothetical protein